MSALSVARSELILGGQKSGKSRRAEMLAQRWLAQSADHEAVFVATAQPWDDEMKARIARHQQERAERVPGMRTLEEPRALAGAIERSGGPKTMVVVDCLTLWLTNLLMPYAGAGSGENNAGGNIKSPFSEQKRPAAQYPPAELATFLIAIKTVPGPVVLVGNEIGLGVIPLGRETRAFVDALGQLNQAVAADCERVTLMVAGLPLELKGWP